MFPLIFHHLVVCLGFHVKTSFFLILEDIRPFVRPLVLLFWTSFDVLHESQSHYGSLSCVLYNLHAVDSADSPLVRHLLTS